jgi:leader peptidase (prepilin peptidase)/N-methyltransferase
MGMLGWLLFQRFILEPGDLDPQHLFVWAFYLVFVSAMVVMAFVDLRYHIIPDQTSSYSIPVGLLGVALLSWAGVEIWPLPSIKQALFGVLLGGGLLTIVSLFFGLVLGREALGWGDVKALAMIGAFLGAFPGVWSILFFASILSAIFGILHLVLFKKRDYLPFAPALALTAILHVFYGDQYLKLCFPTMMP